MASIRARSLTDYEVAADGGSCRLNFLDAEGVPGAVEFPLSCLQSLALAIPDIVVTALRALHHNPELRLIHNAVTLQVERLAHEESVILTFGTPDRYTASFSVGAGGVKVLRQTFEKRSRPRRGPRARIARGARTML